MKGIILKLLQAFPKGKCDQIIGSSKSNLVCIISKRIYKLPLTITIITVSFYNHLHLFTLNTKFYVLFIYMLGLVQFFFLIKVHILFFEYFRHFFSDSYFVVFVLYCKTEYKLDRKSVV